ncbi:MAG: alpha-amylase family glycosyl hydrolase [Glaciecola sp.]|jgi:alpha-amylase
MRYLSLCLLWLLVACGGGNGGGSPKPPQPNPPKNTAPAVSAFNVDSISQQGLVQLSWQISDADNDALTCEVSMSSAEPASRSLSNCQSGQAVTFQVSANGSYSATLRVSDGTAQTTQNRLVAVTQIASANPDPVPSNEIEVMKVYYLHSSERYAGWGLHLWGEAIEPQMETTWQTPLPPTRIESDYAYWEVPIQDETAIFSFIVHFGDLKSPNYDLILRPSEFGDTVWVVEDRVAAIGAGITATPFADEAEAREALAELRATKGNAVAALDLSTVPVNQPASTHPEGWYESANWMEIYVRGYQDSDGDGIGDFNGLTERLPYLAELGITGLWLMPIMESADNDHGYETQDYRAVESDYGTMADFERLLAEAERYGIAIIIDYVVNHAASQNPLFLDAASSADNAYRDWFIWRDTVANDWQLWGRTPWRNSQYGVYYGAFTDRMPDFNLRNPDVIAYHQNSMRFWLNKGVDGFRFDAVGVLVENGPGRLENQPENLDIMHVLREGVQDYDNIYIVCEAPGQFRQMASPSACGAAFNFAAGHAILDSVRAQRALPSMTNEMREANHDAMPLILANHDAFAGVRIYNQLNGNMGQYRLAAATYLLASNAPFTYYGEEIGLAGGNGLQGDHALRTPMSWNNNAQHAGFSTRTPFRALSANFAQNNVEAQSAESDSLYHWYQSLYALRQAQPILSTGEITVHSADNAPVLVFSRELGDDRVYVAINYSMDTQALPAEFTDASTVLWSGLNLNTEVTMLADQSVLVWR